MNDAHDVNQHEVLERMAALLATIIPCLFFRVARTMYRALRAIMEQRGACSADALPGAASWSIPSSAAVVSSASSTSPITALRAGHTPRSLSAVFNIGCNRRIQDR